MRTNIELDEELLREVMGITGTVTKKSAVEEALRLTIRLKAQESVRDLFGKVDWRGDLAEMRLSRFPDQELAGNDEGVRIEDVGAA